MKCLLKMYFIVYQNYYLEYQICHLLIVFVLSINIQSMKYRWIRDDMIQVYKILYDEVESVKALFDVDSKQKGNSLK